GFNFDGSYTNGKGNRPETSTLSVNNFTAKLGSQTFRGSFMVTDFSKPWAELTFKGTLLPAELREYFNLTNIDKAGGSIALNVKLSGLMAKKEKYKIGDLFSLNSRSEATVRSVSVIMKDKNISLSDAGGSVLFNETTTTSGFRFNLNGNTIILDASLTNFPSWAAGNPVSLGGKASVTSSCLKPELFFDNSGGKAVKVKDNGKAPLNLPDKILVGVDFSFDSLVYKTFKANRVKGSMNFKPGQLNFSSLNLNSQKGSMSGNGALIQHADRSFVGRGSFGVNNVDVNEAFLSFNNFGQNFLKSENIAGSLSGNISLVLPVDSMLKPDMKSLTADGKYVLSDGALIDFDPVKALSSFVELSELENIKFEKLENEFFIRNNCFYIPQMEVRSSAVDLSVNGTHTFDNNYQYHVKMLLSELLSNKARRNKSLSDDFGEVEDDGLGRTSVFLKIDGKGEEVKVSYDGKAAGDQVKNAIRKERQTLRNILNEEYGMYKKDTVERKARKPKFRVTWEGTGAKTEETEPPVVKKESIIRNLFKKK
ncbi:MAG: AsmA-like C-terminal region-containing protein, partial [Bacteroidales bacterium]